MNIPTLPHGVTADDILEAIAARVAARVLAHLEAAPTTGRHRFYSAANLPPGAPSWRAARERAASLGVAVVRAGRAVLIVADGADGWDALALAARPRVVAPPKASDDDAKALASMGVLLPLRSKGAAAR
jgi:hypothetical protein